MIRQICPVSSEKIGVKYTYTRGLQKVLRHVISIYWTIIFLNVFKHKRKKNMHVVITLCVIVLYIEIKITWFPQAL